MVSIVIITRNRKDELLYAIESCLRQEGEFEFVIVDNNSSDGTREAVEALAARRALRLKYLFQEENLGVAGARNIGFAESTGEIAYFIDDDAYIEGRPDDIRRVEKFMLAQPDIAIVGTDIYNLQSRSYEYGAFPKGTPPRTEGEVLYFIGCSHFIRRSVFAGSPLYPENLFFEQEERYASLTAWKLGYRVWYTNTMGVIHAPSLSTRISSRERKLNNYLNSFVIKKLLVPTCLLPAVWTMFLLRFLRFTGLQPDLWKTGISLYRVRFVRADRRPMSLSRAMELIRKFGIKKLL